MRVSVVIPTRNRPEAVRQAAESVLANARPPLEIVIVDQSSPEFGGGESAFDGMSNVRWIHDRVPGAARARNTGARAAGGEILAFMDDDCTADADWIQAIQAAFEENPAADMLFGQVLLPPELSTSGGIIPTLNIAAPRQIAPNRRFELFGMSANCAVRRQLFERLGGFDEMLGVGAPLWSAEDFDFQYRVYRAQATVLLRPEVKVYHYGRRSAEQWPSTLEYYGKGDGAFYGKHLRCGELSSAGLFLSRVTRVALRELLCWSGVRPRDSRAPYLRAHFTGLLRSRSYPIDRQRRLYVGQPR